MSKSRHILSYFIITIAMLVSWVFTFLAIFTNNFWWVVVGMFIAIPAWSYGIHKMVEENKNE